MSSLEGRRVFETYAYGNLAPCPFLHYYFSSNASRKASIPLCKRCLLRAEKSRGNCISMRPSNAVTRISPSDNPNREDVLDTDLPADLAGGLRAVNRGLG